MRVDVVVVAGMNIAMMCLLLLMMLRIYQMRSNFKKCTERESDYCYTINCPADDGKNGPCFGFAIRKKTDKDVYYCSNNPAAAVDIAGNPIGK